jgi:hypothetical protein
MNKGLAGLIAVLGNGYAGYVKGNKIEEDRAADIKARDEDRAAVQSEREYQATQRAKAEALQAELAKSQADQVVEDVPSYDASSMTGGDPAAQPTVAYKAAGQTFADRGAAQQAIMGSNSQSAKDKRAAAVLRASGDPAHLDRARQYEEFANKAIAEGTDQILGAISASAPSVDAVKKAGGVVAGQVGAEAADIFNKTGGRWNVQPDTVVQHYVDKDAAGREFVNSRVVDKSGKSLVEDVHHANLMLLDAKSRIAQGNVDTQIYQTGARDAEAVRHSKVVEDETHSSNKAAQSIAQQQVGLAGARLALDRAKDGREAKSWKAQTIEGQIAEIEKFAGPMSAEDKKAYGMKMLGIGGKGKDASASDLALADKIIEKKAENDPTMTPGQIGEMRAKIVDSMAAGRTNSKIESTLRAELGRHEPGSPEYVQTWNEAKSELRMSDAQLVGMGFKQPPATKAARAASNGVRVDRDAAPQQVKLAAVAEAQAALDQAMAKQAQLAPTVNAYGQRALAETVNRAKLAVQAAQAEAAPPDRAGPRPGGFYGAFKPIPLSN